MDLNADLGEGGKEDAQLMHYITSCSIACGGHYGTQETIVSTLLEAQKNNVAVGAHPSFPDPEHFGRRPMNMEKKAFQDAIYLQLSAFENALKEVDLPWQHIKAHGALYHAITSDSTLAVHYFEVVKKFPQVKGIFLPVVHPLDDLTDDFGFTVWREGFADRAYTPAGGLLPRTTQNAVLTNTAAVVAQVEKWQQGKAIPKAQQQFQLFCDTLCIHSDTPNALQHARALAKQFNFGPLA